MLLTFIYVLIIALFLMGRYRERWGGSGQQTESVDRSTDAAGSTPWQQSPGGWTARLPQRGVVSTSPQHSIRGGVLPGGLTSSQIPVWTALDDHQLTRLLKQSSS